MLSEQHGMKLNISGERKQEVSKEENSHSANVNISFVCSAPRPVAAIVSRARRSGGTSGH